MIVFGLGNPEPCYLLTRHNLGFMVVDLLAQELRLKFRRCPKYLRSGTQGELVLIKPLVHMNNSGQIVARVLEESRLEESRSDRFIVVCDDLYLPLGRIRIREFGGNGGHQGLRSIIQALGTQEFPRLRLGIGPPPATDWADFVLSEFELEEWQVVKTMLSQAAQAILCIKDEGLEAAMNRYNPE